MPTGTGIGTLSYATEYQRELSQWFPYVLNFGALYATPNNNRYRWTSCKTIEIPSIRTTGRTNADRDSIGTAQRNYDNAWEPKTLVNERKWSTLVHPRDIDETNYVASIANITKVFNETQKFPEMDAYTISKIYADWIAVADEKGVTRTPDTTALTAANVLSVFDALMLKMDNERVPVNGRILYVTNEVKTLLKNAQIDANNTLSRQINVQSNNGRIDRVVSRLDEVQVIGVPANLMRTQYDFTEGWAVADGAAQINMFLVHPTAVITPVSYEFADLTAPSAVTEGKYYYYEESFEDVFILNKQAGAIQFNITANPLDGVTVSPAANTVDFWGTHANDVQSGLAVANNAITGTLLYYSDPSAQVVKDWGAGNFMCLQISNIDSDATSCKIGLEPSAGSGLIEIINDPDKAGIIKVTNKNTQRFKVLQTVGGFTQAQYFDLSGLTCNES